jgi:hypothetical protein
LKRKTIVHLHTLKEEDGGRGGYAVNAPQRERTNVYCLGVPEMLNNSPTLRSVYSCVKEPLRKTLS